MISFNGKELRVLPFDGVLGGKWYASVTDPKTGKNTEGGFHFFKWIAWIDAFLIASR